MLSAEKLKKKIVRQIKRTQNTHTIHGSPEKNYKNSVLIQQVC